MHFIFYLIPFFITMIVSACGRTNQTIDVGITQQPQPPSPTFTLNDISFITSAQQRCLATPGAHYNTELLHCSCPPGNSFHPSRGCVGLTATTSAQPCVEAGFAKLWQESQGPSPRLARCLDKLYEEINVQLDLAAFTPAEQRSLLETLDRDYFSFAQGLGISFAPQSSEPLRVYTSLTSFNHEHPQAFADLVLRNFRSLPQFGSFEEVPSSPWEDKTWSSGSSEQKQAWQAQCQHHLLPFRPDALAICASLGDLLEQVNHPHSPTLTKHYGSESEMQRLDHGCEQCTLITTYTDTPYELSKKIFIKDNLPIIRSIRLNREELQVNVYLNGGGSIQGIFFSVLDQDLDRGVITAKLRGYNAQWQLAFSRDNAKGDSEAIHRFLVERKHHSPPRSVGPTLGILLLESGVNPLVPLIGQALVFSPRDLTLVRDRYHFATLLEDLARPLGFDLPGASALQRLLFFFDNKTFESGTGHGSQVASLVLDRLPSPRLFVLPPHLLPREPHALAEYIRERQIKIVNISQMFDRSDLHGVNCSSYFTTLFRLLPEVVFIAAAGNTGTLDPDVCPGRTMVKGRFPNAVTIAGSQGETMHPRSSFGRFAAHGAVAFEQPCSGGTISTAPSSLTLQQRCTGTSFAAARVSNALAHYTLQHPDRSAEGLVEDLLATCHPSGLPLACGGKFDLAQLYSNTHDQEHP